MQMQVGLCYAHDDFLQEKGILSKLSFRIKKENLYLLGCCGCFQE